jgi:hypothetical protein
MRTFAAKGAAIALVAVWLPACASQRDVNRRLTEARLAEARVAVAQRDIQIATLSWHAAQITHQLKIRELELAKNTQSEMFVRKLDEHLALNTELQRRLVAAEESLTELSKADEPANELLAPTVARQIEEMRHLRTQSAERKEAYEKLARSLQYLIDTGRLQLSRDPEGRVRVVAPRTIDASDPWM